MTRSLDYDEGMPRLRHYQPKDWDAFVALDLDTGVASMVGCTPEQQADFHSRWPLALKERFGWTDHGPTKNRSVLWVLEGDDGDYAGHLWLAEQEDMFTGEVFLFVNTVAVAQPYRGQGLGRFLMARAETEARERRLNGIRLGVDSANAAAPRLYEDLGYSTTRLTMTKSLHADG